VAGRPRAPRGITAALRALAVDGNRRLDAVALALGAHAGRVAVDPLRPFAMLHAGHALQVAPGRVGAVVLRPVVVRTRAHDRPAVVVRRVVAAVVRMARAVVAARPVAVARIARVAIADAAMEAAIAAVADAAIGRAVVARAGTVPVVVVPAAPTVAVTVAVGGAAAEQQGSQCGDDEIADLHSITPVR